MTRFFISALALLGMGVMATEASAQFSVYDQEGKVLFTMPTTPAYVDFTYNKPITGKENGHDWVDLGLSVKWATMNVGATAPQEYGSYIAWGETETATKSSYGWSTYKHMEEGKSDYNYINKYQTADNYRGGTWYDADRNFVGDNKTTLEKADDAAAANWGGDWTMPSQADWEEIYNNCTYEWTTQNGVNGYKITGSNGNSIFLPAAGYRGGGSLNDEGSDGYYWSSSLRGDYSGYGRSLHFYSGSFDPWSYGRRYYGQSVRPVCPSAENTNGHVAVDLGLPSGKLWAECNVGASTPEASGDYIAWGETTAKEYYDWSTYKHIKEGSSDWQDISKYTAADNQTGAIWYKGDDFVGDNKTTLDPADDSATANWGSEWRMPTAAEWEELYNNTTQTWTNDYEDTGVKGYILTSTKEGHEGASIFLPAAGFRDYGDLYSEGSLGFYWSSSLYEDDSNYGRYLGFDEGFFSPWYGTFRCYGRSVRPVCPSAEP